MKLQCTLVGASDLPGKDANGEYNKCIILMQIMKFFYYYYYFYFKYILGNSDPYCILGIFQLSDMDLQSATVSKNNLEDWYSEKTVKNIVRSSTKPSTQQPQWNEKYEL